MKLSWGNSIKKFQNHLGRTERYVENETGKLVDKTGRNVRADARSYTPVRTGLLKKSWVISKSGRGRGRKVTVSNEQDYATHVEEGTRKTMPRRMLAKAMIRNNRKMKRDLELIRHRTSNLFDRGK